MFLTPRLTGHAPTGLRAAWTLIALVFAAFSASAGQLLLGSPQVSGNDVAVPVTLTGDVQTGVAAMDFVLQYDPAVFEPVGADPGSAARAGKKSVFARRRQGCSCERVATYKNDDRIKRFQKKTICNPPRFSWSTMKSRMSTP